MQYPNSLEPHQVDLLELANLAGVIVKPQILSILIELLSMNIHPHSLHTLLRDICSRRGATRTLHAGAKSKSHVRKGRGDKSAEGISKT